jgi:YbgC/YbaW family acyl-CoA thioester hydrolase
MASEFRMTHRVEFADTDMAGIVHFAKYFRFMEVTEHAFFRSLGFSIAASRESPVGWPRVKAECTYSSPLRFEDEIEVHLKVREKREKGVTYEFAFHRLRPEPTRDVARGIVTAVCVSRDAQGKMKAVAIPPAVAAKIEVAPAGA